MQTSRTERGGRREARDRERGGAPLVYHSTRAFGEERGRERDIQSLREREGGREKAMG